MASLGSSGVSCAGSSASSRDGCDTLWSVNPPGLCFRACTLAGSLYAIPRQDTPTQARKPEQGARSNKNTANYTYGSKELTCRSSA